MGLQFFFVLALCGVLSAQASDVFPLLPNGLQFGVQPGDLSSKITQQKYFDAVSAGARVLEIGVTWQSIEYAPGEYNTSWVKEVVNITLSLNLHLYMGIVPINTDRIGVPSDLAQGNNLRPGLSWNSSEVTTRYQNMLDVVLPILMQCNMFFLSVGNEVDAFLGANPSTVPNYLHFVSAMRSKVHTKYPELSVGTCMTLPSAIAGGFMGELLTGLYASGDTVAFTFYPLNGDFTVKNMSEVKAMMTQLLAVVPPNQVVTLQEYGYPSGYRGNATDGSSPQLQNDFFQTMFAFIKAHLPRFRVALAFKLSEWTAAQCAFYGRYYGITSKLFLEYLCSLGMLWADGSNKMSYETFLGEVRSMAAKVTASP